MGADGELGEKLVDLSQGGGVVAEVDHGGAEGAEHGLRTEKQTFWGGGGGSGERVWSCP